MNKTLLYTATVALALRSGPSLAQHAHAATCAEVVADFQQTAASGTLQKNDHDYAAGDLDAPVSLGPASGVPPKYVPHGQEPAAPSVALPAAPPPP